MGSILSTNRTHDEPPTGSTHPPSPTPSTHSTQQNHNEPLFSTKSIFSSSKRVTKTDIYAEIIPSPGQSLPASVPPIKVMINEHVANTAIDSIQDSQQAANKLSKDLILDLLSNPDIPNQFGTFLNHTFAYEQILQPTRELLYWSLRFPHLQDHLYKQSRSGLNWWLANYGHDTFYPIVSEWLIHPMTRKTVIVPILQTSLKDPVNVMQPTAVLFSQVIPWVKVRHTLIIIHLMCWLA
jgi:hypothetical protein